MCGFGINIKNKRMETNNMETNTPTPVVAPAPRRTFLSFLLGFLVCLILAFVGFLSMRQEAQAPEVIAPAPSYGFVPEKGGATPTPGGAPIPPLYFYGPHNLTAYEGGHYRVVADYTKDQDSLYGFTIAPTFDRALFGRYNFDRDGSPNGMFGSGRNTLAVVDLAKNATAKNVGPDKQTAKWNFEWSPDGKYVAYVVNDGDALEVLDVSANKVVLTQKGEATTPVSWLKSDTFSFVQGGKLYSGSIQNPKAQVVAEGVDNSLCSFEGPPVLVAPLWSPSRTWVGYFTKNGYAVKNVKTGKVLTAKVAVSAEDDVCGAAPDIQVIGFDAGDNLYFRTENGNTTMKLTSITGEQAKYENLYAGPSKQLMSFSPDGAYMVFDAGTRGGTPVITEATGQQSITCHNEFGFGGGLAAGLGLAWSKQQPGTVVVSTSLPKGYVLSVLDLAHCKVLDHVLISEQYGQSGLAFVGVK